MVAALAKLLGDGVGALVAVTFGREHGQPRPGEVQLARALPVTRQLLIGQEVRRGGPTSREA